MQILFLTRVFSGDRCGDDLLLETGASGIGMSVAEANDLQLIFGSVTANHEADVLVRSHAEAICVAHDGEAGLILGRHHNSIRTASLPDQDAKARLLRLFQLHSNLSSAVTSFVSPSFCSCKSLRMARQ